MTVAARLLLDVMALVGGWHGGSAVGRRIVRRRKAPTPKPFGAVATPWQYQPGAFEPTMHTTERIKQCPMNGHRPATQKQSSNGKRLDTTGGRKTRRQMSR